MSGKLHLFSNSEIFTDHNLYIICKNFNTNLKTVKSLVNGRVSTTKGCVPKCSNSTSNYSKSSVTSSCCNQNFCNADLVNRQSVVMPSPYKLNEHPLKCYVCKNCGSDKASVIEECPAVSDYFCSVC